MKPAWIFLTLSGWLLFSYMYLFRFSQVRRFAEQEESTIDAWELKQQRRRETLRNFCNRSEDKSETLRMLLTKDPLLGAHLLVDDNHRAIYCYIPKIGCSNWKRIWMMLRGDTDAAGVDDISRQKLHAFTHNMELLHGNAKIDDVLKKMESYTKFIVVRNPIERLISAYLDKIHYLHGTVPFQKQVLPVVKKQRENAQLTDITLQEFLGFTFTRKGKYNEHWLSYESLCRPCQVNYDVILKLESIDEDAEKFLRLIGAPANLHYPNHVKTVTTSVAENYMKNLTSELIDGVIKEFGNDFLFFGYDFPERRK